MHTGRVDRPRQTPGFGRPGRTPRHSGGQSLKLRASAGQVHVIQRDTPRDALAPPDPHEEISSDFDEEYGPVASSESQIRNYDADFDLV
jgi:hypothetical protein